MTTVKWLPKQTAFRRVNRRPMNSQDEEEEEEEEEEG
jgi:hypothetical protein